MRGRRNSNKRGGTTRVPMTHNGERSLLGRPVRVLGAVKSTKPPARQGVSVGADDGTRTRDPHLGKVMLYQLSHVRARPNCSNLDRPVTTRYVGIDVGSRWLHAVALDDRGHVAEVVRLPAGDVEAVVDWVADAQALAVDSPDGWSTAPHADEAELSPKFRSARCGEVALGRQFGVWVPWPTPTCPAGGWMHVGVQLFGTLRRVGHDPVEVYPHAIFRQLSGGLALPKKRSSAGMRRRLQLLHDSGVVPSRLTAPSHDLVDAAAAALVARDRAAGRATPVTCGHDGTAIWLPTPPGHRRYRPV